MKKRERRKEPGQGSMYLNGRFYDLVMHTRNATNQDLPFYLEQARKYGDPVLDLACGTGRVTLHLAAAGISVVGLDISKPMLEEARAKAKRKGIPVELINGDMTKFALKRKFNLIIMAGNAFPHLDTLASLESCLSSVRKHLTPKGRFIFNIFNPNLEYLTRDPAKRFPITEFTDPDKNEKVIITETSTYDKARQLYQFRRYHQIGQQETSWDVTFKVYFPQELDALLKYNGFIIEAKYGDYEGTHFESDSIFQVVVCRN
ncbi:MAG: class I SAM-dependent DNA methyltransferase [Candidatus Hodarchaeota archaeon]